MQESTEGDIIPMRPGVSVPEYKWHGNVCSMRGKGNAAAHSSPFGDRSMEHGVWESDITGGSYHPHSKRCTEGQSGLSWGAVDCAYEGGSQAGRMFLSLLCFEVSDVATKVLFPEQVSVRYSVGAP